MNIQFLKWPVINCDQVDQLNKMDSGGTVLHSKALLKWLIKLFCAKNAFSAKAMLSSKFSIEFFEKWRLCREYQKCCIRSLAPERQLIVQIVLGGLESRTNFDRRAAMAVKCILLERFEKIIGSQIMIIGRAVIGHPPSGIFFFCSREIKKATCQEQVEFFIRIDFCTSLVKHMGAALYALHNMQCIWTYSVVRMLSSWKAFGLPGTILTAKCHSTDSL